MPTLKDPITIREMKVKNRWGLPPMLTFSSDPNGCPSDKSIMIYEQKARGGVGLITYEATSVDSESVLGGGGAFSMFAAESNVFVIFSSCFTISLS